MKRVVVFKKSLVLLISLLICASLSTAINKNLNTSPLGDKPPEAEFTWAPHHPDVGETVYFTAAGSHDEDGVIVLYEWDWDNDGIYDESYSIPTATHVWNESGEYEVTLRVTDNDGLTDTETETITIGGENSPPEAEFTWWPSHPNAGDIITFDASSSYDEDGKILMYEWDWNNDGIFDESSRWNPIATHVWDIPGEYEVTLRVTDNKGGVDTETETVKVGETEESNYSVDIEIVKPKIGYLYVMDKEICPLPGYDFAVIIHEITVQVKVKSGNVNKITCIFPDGEQTKEGDWSTDSIISFEWRGSYRGTCTIKVEAYGGDSQDEEGIPVVKIR